jgi:hypothetical protein
METYSETPSPPVGSEATLPPDMLWKTRRRPEKSRAEAFVVIPAKGRNQAISKAYRFRLSASLRPE